MKIIGFNFTGIKGERFSAKGQGLSVNVNIDIPSIEKSEKSFSPNEDSLIAKFKYNVEYAPDYVKIQLEGNVLFIVEKKQAKDLLNQWKDKTLSDEVKVPLFNYIIKKTTIKSLELEDELNLPPHLPLPHFGEEDVSKDIDSKEKSYTN